MRHHVDLVSEPEKINKKKKEGNNEKVYTYFPFFIRQVYYQARPTRLGCECSLSCVSNQADVKL